jgi:pilus assembly protein CpaF
MFDSEYRELKGKLHTKVLNEVQLENLYRLGEDTAREQIAQLVREMLQRENTPLALAEREKITREIIDEVFGLGPLERLLGDPTISDILVNTSKIVYIERRGVLEKTDITFNDDAHLMRIIERIL